MGTDRAKSIAAAISMRFLSRVCASGTLVTLAASFPSSEEGTPDTENVSGRKFAKVKELQGGEPCELPYDDLSTACSTEPNARDIAAPYSSWNIARPCHERWIPPSNPHPLLRLDEIFDCGSSLHYPVVVEDGQRIGRGTFFLLSKPSALLNKRNRIYAPLRFPTTGSANRIRRLRLQRVFSKGATLRRQHARAGSIECVPTFDVTACQHLAFPHAVSKPWGLT